MVVAMIMVVGVAFAQGNPPVPRIQRRFTAALKSCARTLVRFQFAPSRAKEKERTLDHPDHGRQRRSRRRFRPIFVCVRHNRRMRPETKSFMRRRRPRVDLDNHDNHDDYLDESEQAAIIASLRNDLKQQQVRFESVYTDTDGPNNTDTQPAVSIAIAARHSTILFESVSRHQYCVVTLFGRGGGMANPSRNVGKRRRR